MQDETYEVKIKNTTFVVSRKYTGKSSLEDILKTAIKRTLQSEAMERRFESLRE